MSGVIARRLLRGAIGSPVIVVAALVLALVIALIQALVVPPAPPFSLGGEPNLGTGPGLTSVLAGAAWTLFARMLLTALGSAIVAVVAADVAVVAITQQLPLLADILAPFEVRETWLAIAAFTGVGTLIGFLTGGIGLAVVGLGAIYFFPAIAFDQLSLRQAAGRSIELVYVDPIPSSGALALALVGLALGALLSLLLGGVPFIGGFLAAFCTDLGVAAATLAACGRYLVRHPVRVDE